MSHDSSSHHGQTSRIRAACRELELALENFDQTDNAHANQSDANAKAIRSTPEINERTAAHLKRIHDQLLDIRRQLDELS